LATIAAFTVKRTASNLSIGTQREAGSAFSPVVLSNLVLTLNDARSADWKSWADDFLINGHNLDNDEKTGTLDLLNASRQVVLSLQFSHLGITRLTRLPATGGGSAGRLEAELYYESLAILQSVSSANGPSTVAPPLAASSPTSSGADQVARDLSNFPHVDGLVKKSYASSQGESSSDENANYSSTLNSDAVAAKYESMLKDAGWEEISRSESGDASAYTHFVRRQWKKSSQSADIRITQTKTNGSDIYVATKNSRVGILSATANAMKQINPDTAPAAGSPNDQGARDPANFPRIAGSVRRSYAASGSAAAPHEDAAYRAKVPIAQVEAFYVNRLSKSDWEQSERRETDDADGANHQITLIMNLGRTSATIYLKEIQPEITDITIMSATSAP
jgi:hypothetical protein